MQPMNLLQMLFEGFARGERAFVCSRLCVGSLFAVSREKHRNKLKQTFTNPKGRTGAKSINGEKLAFFLPFFAFLRQKTYKNNIYDTFVCAGVQVMCPIYSPTRPLASRFLLNGL
jgi:hypothetical protein